MDVKQFEARLKTASESAQALIEEIRACVPDYKEVCRLTKRYVCLKFMLDEADAVSDDILELAQQSIEQIARLKKDGLKFNDHSGTCAAVSSTVTKKILLFMALQKGLGVEFPKSRTPYVTTIGGMAELIISQLQTEGV